MKFNKVLSLGSWVLGLGLLTLSVFGQGTPIATTAFTRTMLRGADSAAVRASLGFLSTNNTVITNYVGNGASITNLNADELRSGTVPLARLTGITATQIADSTITTNKVDATAYAAFTASATDVTQSGLAAGSYAVKNKVHLTRNGFLTNSFSTIGAAVAVALPGDLIEVFPGTYTEHHLLKTNVHYFGHPGADIFYNQSTNDNVYGIFDDRHLLGGTTNTIVWNGTIFYLGSTNGHAEYGVYSGNEGSRGAFVTTNPATVINIKVSRVIVRDIAQFQSVAAFSILNCRRADIDCDFVGSPNFSADGTAMTVTVVDDPFVTSAVNEFAMGLWWEQGTTFARIGHIQVNNYSVWPEGRDGEGASELWFTGDLLESKIYVNAGTNTGYKSWFTVKEVRSLLSPGLTIYGGGLHYFNILKLSSGTGQPMIDASSQAGGTASSGKYWITLQKGTSDTKIIASTATNHAYDITSMQFDYTGTGEGITLAGTSHVYPEHAVSGRTNIAAAASSIVVQLPRAMISTNYTPSVTLGFDPVATMRVSAVTRTNFTVTFSTGVTTGGNVFWNARLNAQ
jgi:hypothetical protein